MKYKIGDKVKMRKSEFSFGSNSFYEMYNYILTIAEIDGGYYRMEEDLRLWYREYSFKEYEERTYIPIENRFEILDL